MRQSSAALGGVLFYLSVDTIVLPTHTLPLLEHAVHQAAELLRAGELVAVPTETVYGLAANAFDAAAVQRIFDVKGRPAHNPIIVHVASIDLARECVSAWPEKAARLAAAYWPGPLTLVLPRSNRVPDVVTAGGSTVGVRWPAHPFMQRLIAACGFPLAAPSANPSGQVSATTAQHVADSLWGKVPLIVDGGPSNVGLESTVVDMTVMPPKVLRPGMIDRESIGTVLGEPVLESRTEGPAVQIKSPGLLEKHYAPKARLLILSWNDEAELASKLGELGIDSKSAHILAHAVVPSGSNFHGVSVIPHDPEAYARALYAELHRADQGGVMVIIAEAVPDEPRWQAIADRLGRASAP